MKKILAAVMLLTFSAGLAYSADWDTDRTSLLDAYRFPTRDDTAASGDQWQYVTLSLLSSYILTPPTVTGQVIESTGVGTWEWVIPTTYTAGTYISLANDQISVSDLDDAVEFVIDGGGSAITTGVKGYLEIPWGATINRATLLCDQSGSIVVDVWKDTYANYPPVDADSITASAPPTVTTATNSQDSALTGWTTAITAGDIIGFNVDSATTVERCTISLKVTR